MRPEHHTPRKTRKTWTPRDPRPPLRRTRGGKTMTPEDREELRDWKAREFDRMVAAGEIETVTVINVVEGAKV